MAPLSNESDFVLSIYSQFTCSRLILSISCRMSDMSKSVRKAVSSVFNCSCSYVILRCLFFEISTRLTTGGANF